MTPTIDTTNTIETKLFSLVAEASDLGFSPISSNWPHRLETVFGNGEDFVLCLRTAEYAGYQQWSGCMYLKVFND